ncbi:DUF2188 domain-containing protein [Clavibacter sp. VKM Ac-2873]|uniref:DUF2188 domain-containing protein n=1 Tax=Clavibacter sp. VKM Ac-2873 TaxID=2783813 RepID=UPI00188A6CC4|nr:DUF2188 domain-containing protein [Clavibacter sp. VKM Ac-2873]MBF4619498.1 DUF2188 domain-containing protein [Clavibacter sp. VKM Ac-2873]
MSKQPKDDPNKEWKKKVQKGRALSKGNDNDRHVVPNADRGGWDVVKEGHQRASAHAPTQKAAEKRAKEIVEKSGKGNGEVVIHGKNGQIRDSDSGSRNEGPKKDNKH